MIRKVKFLPKDVYDIVLKYTVIPTFDLVIEYGSQGVILVKRKIPPYKNEVSFLKVIEMVMSSKITDSYSVIGLLKTKEFLKL